jgi:hypothetical protein
LISSGNRPVAHGHVRLGREDNRRRRLRGHHQVSSTEGVRFVDWDEALASQWDLVAMFDVFERIPDLGFLPLLQTRYLAVASIKSR